ncbi:MAG: hypothetical protein ACRED9_11945 [Caulobacteraceae bacterium]
MEVIISHERHFIFIKTYKTAGASIEAYLSAHCGPGDVLTPAEPPVAGHVARNQGEFYNHIPAHKVRAAVGEEIGREYTTLCVERNPRDKFISYYFKLRNPPRRGRHTTLIMDDYLEAGPFPLNAPLYTDAAGEKIIVDRVMQYKNLAAEMRSVFRIGRSVQRGSWLSR